MKEVTEPCTFFGPPPSKRVRNGGGMSAQWTTSVTMTSHSVKNAMRRIPNILSTSRIALCLPLLLVDAMTVPFWVLYVIAGTTDMVDGFLARRWGVDSRFGARLDSLADFVFVLAAGYKLFPYLKLPATLWLLIGLIALVKASNAIGSYIVKHRIEFLHTKANRLTGFLLFVGVMTIGQSFFIPVAWVIACIALFAAIQEGHYIRRNKR